MALPEVAVNRFTVAKGGEIRLCNATPAASLLKNRDDMVIVIKGLEYIKQGVPCPAIPGRQLQKWLPPGPLRRLCSRTYRGERVSTWSCGSIRPGKAAQQKV